MIDRDGKLKQIDRWVELVREEASRLIELGIGPNQILPIATSVADARLGAEVMAAQDARARLAMSPGTPRQS
jgi:Asp-tRNA(Asn)/Glu-tRNA(Gln) amidotransferase A subunit family amidase